MNLPAFSTLLVLCAGCTKSHKPPSDASFQAQVDETVHALAAARGVAPSVVRVRVVDSSDFSARLRTHWARIIAGHSQHAPAVWQAFGFANHQSAPQEVARRIVDERETTGFFDGASRELVLRRPQSAKFDARADTVIVHELEHALQPGEVDRPNGLNDDSGLAEFALREGDAQVAAMAYFARRTGKDPQQAIDRAATLLPTLPLDSAITSLGFSNELASANILMRESLVRARLGGLELAATLVRSGGFALLDRALRSPPTSMKQVLEPARYTRGESPVSFDLDGGAATGSFGVVGIAAFLGRCLPTDRAKQIALGWTGDRYEISADETVTWISTWTEEAAAWAFADALTGPAMCADSSGTTVRFEVLRRATSVAAVKSRRGGETSRLMEVLLRSARGPTAAKPPLGDVQLQQPHERLRFAGRRQLDVAGTGRLDAAKYVNERIGFSATVPPGFEPHVDQLLDVDRGKPSMASGRTAFEQSAAPFVGEPDFFASYVVIFSRRMFGGLPLHETSAGRLSTPFGEARTHEYSNQQGRPIHLRLVALPLCAGKAALVIAMVWMDADGQAALAKWLTSFAPLDKPEICGTL